MQGESPVGGEQQVQAADQQHEGSDDLNDAGADEGAHHVDIAGGTGQKLAGLGTVMVAERETLDVIVERVAQVVRYALRHPCREHALQIGEQGAQRGDADYD